jgi:hypothetical protein
MRLVSLSAFSEIVISCRRAPLHILMETTVLSLVAVASLRCLTAIGGSARLLLIASALFARLKVVLQGI